MSEITNRLAGQFSQHNRLLQITTPLGEDKVLLTGVDGEDAISRPYLFRIDLATHESDERMRSLLGKPVTLTLSHHAEAPGRPVHGLIPRPIAGFTPKGAVDRLRRMAEQKERDPKSLSISVFRAPGDKAALAEYREAGIDEALLEIPDVSRDEILQLLDHYAPLAAA